MLALNKSHVVSCSTVTAVDTRRRILNSIDGVAYRGMWTEFRGGTTLDIQLRITTSVIDYLTNLK